MHRMEDIRSIVGRLPQRELDIRRRWLCDEDFRSVCMDYEDATSGLRYWQTREAEEKDLMVREYAELMAELEAEILALLDRPPQTSIAPDRGQLPSGN